MAWTAWTREEQLAAAIEAKASGFIYKHSSQCGISTEARDELRKLVERHPEIDVFEIAVIESRPVSNAVAARLDVEHASPQAILLRRGEAAWSATHWEITLEALESAWERSGVGEAGSCR